MAKDRIDRNELADKLVETASAAEDPLRAMAEMIADFVRRPRSRRRSAPNRTRGVRSGPAIATGTGTDAGIRGWGL